MSERNAVRACRVALGNGLRESSPDAALDARGYVADAAENLVAGFRLDDVRKDLESGSGNELENKFRAAHSSSALGVNVFAPFKARRVAPLLPGGDGGFSGLRFERKCSAGVRGTAPNLDVVVEGARAVVAIESKCLEPLSRHDAKFADAYRDRILDARRDGAWFREMMALRAAPQAYRWLDAAQLVKHAFGLAHSFPDRPVTLLYLFWEPANPEAFRVFAEHRAEIGRFARAVEGDGQVAFAAMSYPELWRSWVAAAAPDWLPAHIGRLRARYLRAA
ncbi:PGN_0703 family putative restriction endonuclease [Oceanibacterium hippocampi]|uniref:Uncharacterized protein n=1 Tax=Oceanibacterium hippocampi TaxID=745714 RepID=A0A1Y5S3Y0_9PROT|nr:hypothetical protein [Oceanibacterium hippocampi]SLN31649.1 hypothetical protein OCH7691_01132 [Oceanibacterium hippocampi]